MCDGRSCGWPTRLISQGRFNAGSLLRLATVCAALTFAAPANGTTAWIYPPVEGSWLAFTAINALKPRGFSIGAVEIKGSEQVVLVRGSQGGLVPNPFSTISWSSDGGWLAFAGSEGKRKGIYTLCADGSDLRFLHGTEGGRNPIFSPDGSKIAFARDRLGGGLSQGATTTWVANANGRAAFRLMPWRKNVEYLPSSFSPDASVLAVTRRNLKSGKSDVVLFRLGGSQSVRVLARRASEAVFSPDGSQIALVRETISRRRKTLIVINKDLYVLSVNGTESSAVTRTHHITETRPSWDPSGQRIAFNAYHISRDPIEALFNELLPIGNSILQINADGSCRQKILSQRNVALRGPVWQPGADRAVGPSEC
jgi:Tol biopolymer transport system component